MPFEWLKVAHVVTIIAAIALAEGPILPTYLAARRRDVVAIRQMIRAGQVGERVANPLAAVSIGFGIAAAITRQIDLTAPWLMGAYGALGLAIAIGALGGFRHIERIGEAAELSPPDTASPELVSLIEHPWTLVITVAPPVLMAAVVALMVTKPTL